MPRRGRVFITATQARWQISGDYFENCNCDVPCPCIHSPNGPLTGRPTYDACEVPFAFHIDQGSHGDVTLDGLNAVVILRTPRPMAEGNGSVALYVDERADESQTEALTAIFSGGAGGPNGALAPLVTEILGVKSVPITYRQENRRRSVEIPANAHPLFPDKVAMAIGESESTFEDYGMRWDNSSKNGNYAPFTWSNA